MDNNLLEKVVSLCKRRGFIFPGSEIYGGLAGIYDYGPMGVELATTSSSISGINLLLNATMCTG